MKVIISFVMLNKEKNQSPITIIINNMTMLFRIKNDNALQFSSIYGKYIDLQFESNIECRRAYEFVLTCIQQKALTPDRFYEEDTNM
jgi:hypothetical protein